MSSFNIKQTVVENLSADLESKQPVGDYVTNASLDEEIQSNLLNYTTNRILEIPQDIKVELNDGTLTLKAGSKVYVPNGFEVDGSTKKFDVVTTTKDLTYTEPTSNPLTIPLFVSSNGNGLFRRGNNNSGETVPDNYNGAFYNLAKNRMESYENGSLAVTMSLPICVCTNTASTGNNMTSIDQIFNGFGFIGSTVFTLPGLKALCPCGKDENGTILSNTVTTNNVGMSSLTNHTGNYYIMKVGNNPFFIPKSQRFIQSSAPDVTNLLGICYWYNSDEYQWYVLSEGDNRVWLKVNNVVDMFAESSAKVGKLYDFKTYQVNNINNYHKTDLSNFSMPSLKSISLTLGSNGTRYVAPANGWFSANFTSSLANSWLVLENRVKSLKSYSITTKENGEVCAYLPVSANDTCILGINTNSTYSTDTVRQGLVFIYANGEQ